MEHKTLNQSAPQFDYKSEEFDHFISTIENQSAEQSYFLVLLAGSSQEKKKQALDLINEEVEREVYHVDANVLFNANEKATVHRIDELFETYDAGQSILYIDNGANLCGAFTGYSLSKVKYATPQERYLIKKIKENNAFVVIDFETLDGADITLIRASRAVITFPVPTSGLQGFLTKLGQIKLNGFDLNSKRPVPSQNTMPNF